MGGGSLNRFSRVFKRVLYASINHLRADDVYIRVFNLGKKKDAVYIR